MWSEEGNSSIDARRCGRGHTISSRNNSKRHAGSRAALGSACGRGGGGRASITPPAPQPLYCAPQPQSPPSACTTGGYNRCDSGQSNRSCDACGQGAGSIVSSACAPAKNSKLCPHHQLRITPHTRRPTSTLSWAHLRSGFAESSGEEKGGGAASRLPGCDTWRTTDVHTTCRTLSGCWIEWCRR